MITYFKQLFCSHAYTPLPGTALFLGFLRGSSIYQVDCQCRCGKITKVETDDLAMLYSPRIAPLRLKKM